MGWRWRTGRQLATGVGVSVATGGIATGYFLRSYLLPNEGRERPWHFFPPDGSTPHSDRSTARVDIVEQVAVTLDSRTQGLVINRPDLVRLVNARVDSLQQAR